MIVTVPFAYKIGTQDGDHAVRVETIKCDIPDVRVEDTAVVATWMHQFNHGVPPRPIECRTYGGDYFYRVTKRTSEGVADPRFVIAGFYWRDIARHIWFYDSVKQRACDAVFLRENEPFQSKPALGQADDRAFELDRATKGLTDLLFIDDVLWCRARSPRLSFTIHGEPNAKYGILNIVAVPLHGSPSGRIHPMVTSKTGTREFRFHLDEMAEAEEFATRLGLRCENLVGDIDIVGEVANGLHPETWLTMRSAMEAVEGIGGNLASLPADIVSMWLDLRSLITSRDVKLADDIDQKLHEIHRALGKCGQDDLTLSAYISEIEIMRSLGLKRNGKKFGLPRPR
jgi:hypothetical protein